MPKRANPAFFKPPPETFSMFDDLVEDDDDRIEEESEANQKPVVSSTRSHNQGFRNLFAELFKPRRDSEYSGTRDDFHVRNGHGAVEQTRKKDNDEEGDDDEPAVFLNKSRRLPTLTEKGRRLPKYLRNPTRRSSYSLPVAMNVFQSTARQRKRIEQLQRLVNTEAEVCKYLEEFPTDTVLCGKLLHIQAFKGRLEGGEDEVLSGGEVKLLHETSRLLERRRIANQEKAFLREAQEKIRSRGGGGGGSKNVKRKNFKREETVVRSSSNPSSSLVRKRSYSPPLHPTTSGKTVCQDSKRQKFVSDDVDDDNDDEEEEHRAYGGKTIGHVEAFKVEHYDVHAVLQEQEDGEEGNGKNDEESEESDDSDGSSGDETDSDGV
ncbi:hypothetical protein UA08_09343 [Talaromyces atroroseus]|uniref:Uncharacterized protein n=1 Tax=Talaromyces atroroseus TaxID=1441469 RepID=A0A1Q5Q6C6_TALAT|nr:hypothetical protein UA08_09343 [Talaromyces atroroseus]OKL55392.1 hypothetical protein UA08_09343 [Talaromyces atroroseus]